MKGKVFGGFAYFPNHPKADMHGHVRLVIRTKGYLYAATALRFYGINFPVQLWNEHIWQESKSVAEITATSTHYGQVMACSVVESYLSAERYAVIPKGLKNG
jgi:hypothetical protein